MATQFDSIIELLRKLAESGGQQPIPNPDPNTAPNPAPNPTPSGKKVAKKSAIRREQLTEWTPEVTNRADVKGLRIFDKVAKRKTQQFQITELRSFFKDALGLSSAQVKLIDNQQWNKIAEHFNRAIELKPNRNELLMNFRALRSELSPMRTSQSGSLVARLDELFNIPVLEKGGQQVAAKAATGLKQIPGTLKGLAGAAGKVGGSYWFAALAPILAMAAESFISERRGQKRKLESLVSNPVTTDEYLLKERLEREQMKQMLESGVSPAALERLIRQNTQMGTGRPTSVAVGDY